MRPGQCIFEYWDHLWLTGVKMGRMGEVVENVVPVEKEVVEELRQRSHFVSDAN